MPLYEYVCKKCEHHFEALVFGSDVPECPTCHGTELDKQFSTYAVGSGGPRASARPMASPCGSCGDPRGPGACSMKN